MARAPSAVATGTSSHMMDDELYLWQWRYTDEFGKRRVVPCRLTAEDAKHLKNAARVEGSLEIRHNPGSTSDFRRPPLRTHVN